MTTDTKPVFRVLLAEDVKLNQMLTQKLLARSGYLIDIAENGIQAIEAMKNTDYDVILMDVQMPEMDGIEATKQIRQLPGTKKFVPIIALTAQADVDTEDELRAAGMDDYISKPINFDILFSKLSALAAKRGA
ncbi:MAG TPA: response regulator [Alphaproteobacteria bacterium]|jgi:CheY-like chemotaxis protein|nr:response regulator [Alphaproteobacteria bacterium]